MIKACGIIIMAALLGACGGTPPQKLPEPLQSAADAETRGIVAYRAGRYPTSIKHFSTALKYYKSIDHPSGQARAYINLAQSALAINQLELVRRQIDQLEELINYANLKTYSSRLLLLKSTYLTRLQAYQQAIEITDRIIDSADIETGTQNGNLKTAALINRAILAVKTDDPQSKARILETRRLLDKDTEKSAYIRLLRLEGELELAQKNHTAAEQLLKNALSGYRETLYQPGIAASLADLGELKLATGEPAIADIYLKRALDIRLIIGDRYTAETLLNRLYLLEQSRNNVETAEKYQRQLKKLRNQSDES